MSDKANTTGRNDKCPCGSGKKYKQCCMQQQKTFGDQSSNLPFQIGMQYMATGRTQEAEAVFRQILHANPKHADALHYLGVLAYKAENLDEAAKFIRRSINVNPSDSLYYCNFGNVLKKQGKLDEAIINYQKALSLNPDFPGAHYNLGLALHEQGAFDDAINSYYQALSTQQNSAVLHNNLGNSLQAVGRIDDAIQSYLKAISLNDDYAEAYNNLGTAYQAQNKLSEATQCFSKAITSKKNYAVPHMNMGSLFLMQGKANEAADSYSRALACKPDYEIAHSSLLLAMQYSDLTKPRDIFEEHKRFATVHETPKTVKWKLHHNNRDSERRIKIGYVSPDFREHSVAYFIEPILENHDKSRFEIYCYFNNGTEGKVTQRIASFADHWIPCKAMTNAQLYEKIRSDGIDILVDLAGHTANNRLMTFSLRPAPVQVTYLGYPDTTGLSSIAYRLTDIHADPIGVGDEFHTEKLVRLPQSFLCYRPSNDAPEVCPSPVMKNEFITFASFNNLLKVTPKTVSLWSRILHATPGAKMLLKSHGLDSKDSCESVLAMFKEHGIREDRLTLLPKDSGMDEHLARYHSVDICLDTFPYHGVTTTCEALWMGVPTITLRGDRHVARVGVSLLLNAGLGELIATNEDEFVNIAVSLAGDTSRLSSLRNRMRQQLSASPLFDGPGLTTAIENAFREMWRTWCAT